MAGWNGSDRKGAAPVQPKVTAKKPSPVRGVIAGVVTIVVLCVACYFIFGTNSRTGNQGTDKDRGLIKEATPAKTKKADTPVNVANPRKQVEKVAAAAEEVAKETVETAKNTNNVYVVPAPTNRIFKTGLEQVLNMIFNTEVGNFPGPLPHIHANEEENLAGILISANKILESDDERVRAKKEQVDFAKKELIKFIKEGGTYQEFLRYYHGELVKAFRERKDCQRAVDEFGEQEGVDASMVREFHKKVNAKLAEKGIKPVDLPDEYQDENETQEN